MVLLGESLIGQSSSPGGGGKIVSVDMNTGAELKPQFNGASAADLAKACALAEASFDAFRSLPLKQRAKFLTAIGEQIGELGDDLIVRCMAETGLPRARLEGERARTVGQFRMFADIVLDGSFLNARIDLAMPDRKPLPRSDLRLQNIPVGPVAVFGASNFPLAFSVAGGDTASAFAAGCPVVAKAHSAHLGTSELVGRAVQKAAQICEMPEGVFSLLFDSGYEIGQGLVADPRIKAVGFTGSRRGGVALMKTAAARPEPIPVYAEMSSINPVILLPGALAARGKEIGEAFVAAMTLGAGQFCTNPGLVLAVGGKGLDSFIDGARAAVTKAAAATMLTPGIHGAYCTGVEKFSAHKEVKTVATGPSGGQFQGRSNLFVTSADAFLKHHELQDEVFGASSLIVQCNDQAQLIALIEALEGQLTAAVHLEPSDYALARPLMPLLEKKVGRILFDGFGTGVEVSYAMVHGGPYPSTSDGRTTSVGALAIERFLRPVCYQDVPADLLPPALKNENQTGVWRRINGASPPTKSSI
jgi:2,5-dioxopentanoate dehydrogenase